MEHLMGVLRIRIIRGVNLAVRDVSSSDPYVIVRRGKHNMKTCVVNNTINPEWNEDLNLSIVDPTPPVKIEVYDKDTFTLDDKMGEAEFDIGPFLEAQRMNHNGLQNGTIITRIQASRQNCLSEESCIVWADKKVVQNMWLRLRNVETGEIQIQLQWIHVPGSRGL